MPSTPRFKASVPRHPRKARLFILALVLISVLFSLCTIWYILLGWSSWRTFLDAPQTVVPTRDFEVLGRSALNLSLDEASSFSSVTASIAVVLPVTLPSVAGIRRALSDILVAIPSSSEIVLVVSPTLQVAVRDILRLMLSSEDGLDQIDISIHTWPSTSSEALATLSAARTVSSDWVAILGIHGLSKLDDAHKDALFSTTLTPLPLGVVGYDASLACIDPLEAPIPVQYLQPPFLAPTSLIPPLESIESRSTNLWRTFGEYVSSRRSDGFGGLLAGVHKSIGLSLCATLLDDDYLVDQQSSPSFAHQNDESKSLPISASHAVNTAIFAFPSLTDLRHLYPAICKLQQGSYSILALVVSGNSDHDLPANNIDSILHAKLGRCDVNITTSPQLLTVDDAKLILMEWFNKHPSPSLVVTPNQDHILLSALDLVLNQQPNLTLHRLRIPTLDLPFCDWMGTLSLSELQNWHRPQVEIVVITHDRPKSLIRLLNSLATARYFGDRINIRINMEQTVDEETLRVIGSFNWEYGTVSVTRRVVHGGLLPAVVESWYPSDNHSYGLILEDDVEVSPLFYAWVKMSLLRYRYGHLRNRSPNLFGISLYQQKTLELRPEGRHRFSARTVFSLASLPALDTPYVSQIPCSWGAIYFPEHWRQFHNYLTVRLSGSHPSLPLDAIVAPGLRSNKWTRSWKKYFIEMVYLRGYVMLYPNFENYVSLSTNHLEVGSHVKDVPPGVYLQKQKLFRHPLMRLPSALSGIPTTTRLLELPREILPSWNSLPVLDLLGLLTTEDALIHRGQKRIEDLLGCRPTPGTQDTRKWLCIDRPEEDP